MDSKRIKFLVFSASYPYRGGISDSTHSLCNELTKNNIETEVWTFSLLYPNFLFPGKTQFSNEVYEQNFKIKRIINTISLLNWIKVSKKVNKINPEVLILRYWSPILYLPYFFIGLFLKKKIKVVGLVDNWDNHEKLPFERFFRYLFISTCNYFISFSKNIGNKIKQSTNKKVISLFHPINTNLPELIDQKTAKNILGLDQSYYISFVGIIREYKGLKTLIKSIKFLKNENIKLIIAGEFYDPIYKYLKIINELNLNEKIIIDNRFLDSKMLRNYVCASDLIIQPYTKASQSGITPICYHYNTPMVVSNINGLKEIIQKDKSGEIFDKTPKNLSKAILKGLEKKRNENYKSNIKKSRGKYSWLSFIKQIQSI